MVHRDYIRSIEYLSVIGCWRPITQYQYHLISIVLSSTISFLSSRSESSSSGSRSNADEASPERESTNKRLQQSSKPSKSWADEVEDEEERRETASRGLEGDSSSKGPTSR